MNITSLLKTAEKFSIDNSPAILTAIGVVGTIGTAVLTHKAATEAEKIMARRLAEGKKLPVERKAKVKASVKLLWKVYAPPVVAGTVTVACIIGANHIGSKRAAALATAYTIADKAHAEYVDKVKEKMGANKERAVRDEIAQDRVRNNPPTEGNVLMVGGGDHLFLEMYTGRYFRSSIENIRRAVNDINHMINTHGYASVSDFYGVIGLANTKASDTMGWTSDKLMDVDYSAVLSEQGEPCVAINFATEPVGKYDRFR